MSLSASATSTTTTVTSSPPQPKLLKELHVSYVQKLGKSQGDLTYHLTAHLRLNAIYWGYTATQILGFPDALSREEMIDFVMSCWDEEAGAFGAHPGHDAHLLSTLSAIQILVMQEALDRMDADRVTQFILKLQQPSGVFAGDRFGEIDTRFLYCAVNALSLLGRLDRLDKEKAVEYIVRCRNYDGGFGNVVGAESHAAQAFVCTAALAILDRLDVVDVDTLGWWLAERQLPNGGLNGRPEKLEDVCYSFWVLSALSILNKVSWIDADKLSEFILSAQDPDGGGIADRPGDMVDVFHTHFGVAGLSILGYPGLVDLDPVYCMPAHIIEARGLRKGWKALERRQEASYSYNMANNATPSLLTIMPSLRLFNLEIPNPLAMLSGTSKSSDSKPLPHNDDAEMDYCMPISCSVQQSCLFSKSMDIVDLTDPTSPTSSQGSDDDDNGDNDRDGDAVLLDPMPIQPTRRTRPLSAASTLILERDHDEIVQDLKKLGVKVRDFAVRPITQPGSVPSVPSSSNTSSSSSSSSSSSLPPVAEIISLRDYLAEVDYRWSQRDRQSPIHGKVFRRLLDAKWLSQEEFERRAQPMDREALAWYDALSFHYPYRVLRDYETVPTEEERKYYVDADLKARARAMDHMLAKQRWNDAERERQERATEEKMKELEERSKERTMEWASQNALETISRFSSRSPKRPREEEVGEEEGEGQLEVTPRNSPGPNDALGLGLAFGDALALAVVGSPKRLRLSPLSDFEPLTPQSQPFAASYRRSPGAHGPRNLAPQSGTSSPSFRKRSLSPPVYQQQQQQQHQHQQIQQQLEQFQRSDTPPAEDVPPPKRTLGRTQTFAQL